MDSSIKYSYKHEVAIFIANYKSFPLTADCIENIKNVTGLNYRLYIYDLDPENNIDEVEYFHALWVNGEHSYVKCESPSLTNINRRIQVHNAYKPHRIEGMAR